MSKVKAGGVIRNERLARIGVLSAPDRPGLASELLRALAGCGINVEFIVQCVDQQTRSHVVLCVADEALGAAMAALGPVKEQVQAEELVGQRGVALISVFGPDFRERPAIAAAVFESMASAGINIIGISTSISTVSCLIEKGRSDDALTALRERFEFP